MGSCSVVSDDQVASIRMLERAWLTGKPPHPRSPRWPAVRSHFLLKHPSCAGCGGTEDLEVHHKMPVHEYPQLELVEDNLVVLCEKSGHCCHYHLGHLLSWVAWNVDVEDDAARFLKKVVSRRTSK